MSVSRGYSLDNARDYAWSSVTGQLNPGRVSFLDEHLIGQKILDAGCGGGAYCDYVARRGMNVVGVDLHPEFLDAARQRFPSIDFRQADLAQLPFEDKSFDTVFCFDVLEHVDDEKVLEELSRVAKKRLIVAVPRESSEMRPFNLVFSTYVDTTHLRYYDDDSLSRLIQAVLPSADVHIHHELMLPVATLLEHLCDAERLGYTGFVGVFLRCLRFLGVDSRAVARNRGHRRLQNMAEVSGNQIPTGLIATIDLP